MIPITVDKTALENLLNLVANKLPYAQCANEIHALQKSIQLNIPKTEPDCCQAEQVKKTDTPNK